MLPIGQSLDLSPDERKEIYLAAAALVAPNISDFSSVEVTNERFNVYAPILPGRRKAYDLDDLGDDENMDSMSQRIDMKGNPNMDWMSRNQTDFANEEEARLASAETFNSTELSKMMSMLRSQESKAPPTISVDGVLDEEVEDRISRWKDDEWERRINSVIIS